MDRIIIKGMKFFAYHGVLPEEQEKGQYFIVDAVLFSDLKKAGESDVLSDSIDYSKVFEVVREITQNNRFRLVEKLADSISRGILSSFEGVNGVEICVKKPDAPIVGDFEWAGIQMTRFRDDPF